MTTYGYGHSLGIVLQCAAVMWWYITGGGPGLVAIVMMGSVFGAVFAMFLRRVYLRAYTGDPLYLSVDVAKELSTLTNSDRFAPRLLSAGRYRTVEFALAGGGLVLLVIAVTGSNLPVIVGGLIASAVFIATAGWLPDTLTSAVSVKAA